MENALGTAIEQMRFKEEAGINYIYAKTYNYVYLRANSILRRESDVQQLVKDTYLQMIENATEITEATLYEWLGKCVYTLGCDYYRKKKEREAENLEMDASELESVDFSNKEISIEVIEGTLEQLPDLYHATMYAFYYDYMPIADIAEMMGCSIAVIANRLNYARKYMIKALKIHEQEKDVVLNFHVEIVRDALRKWSLDNCMGAVAAQTIYSEICKAVGISSSTISLEGKEFAGVNHTLVYYTANDLEPIRSEVELYGKRIGPNKKLLVIVIGIGLAVCFLALIVSLFGGKGESKPKKNTPSEKVEEQQKEETSKGEDKEHKEEKEEPVEEPKEEVKKEEVEEKQEVTSNEYILSESSSRVLTREELQGLTKEQLRLARNEIFARHGMIFGVEDLDSYFSSQAWYKPTIPGDEFYDKVDMNMIEEANISLIWEVESEME